MSGKMVFTKGFWAKKFAVKAYKLPSATTLPSVCLQAVYFLIRHLITLVDDLHQSISRFQYFPRDLARSTFKSYSKLLILLIVRL